MPELTICGGGNAAHVLAALAAHAGWETHLFAPFGDEARRLRAGAAADEGITVHFAGGLEVTGRPQRISADPAAVIPGSKLVLLALPAFAHQSTLVAVAPYLNPEAAIGALPARGGFDYQTRTLLAPHGHAGPIFGLQTLPWACRVTAYGRAVAVLGVKAVVAAAVTAQTGQAKAEVQAALWPTLHALLGVPLQPLTSFLALTLANMGQIVHPGAMFGMCQGQEERTFAADEIPLFYQGIDAFTADILQAMSDEVRTIAVALAEQIPQFDASEVPSLQHWLLEAYPLDIEDGSSLRRALATNGAYRGLRLPVRPAGGGLYQIDFNARYLTEDVPFGLVVARGIAELASVATPALDRIIQWAQDRTGRQYLVDGALAGADWRRSRAPQAYGIHDVRALAAWEWGGSASAQPAARDGAASTATPQVPGD